MHSYSSTDSAIAWMKSFSLPKRSGRVRWVNCCYFKLLISCMLFVCFRFYLLGSKLELDGHCIGRKAAQWHNLLIQKFANGMPYCRTTNTKIMQYSGINLRTAQKIKKELNEFDGELQKYSSSEALLIVVIRKQPPNLLLRSMIDNNSNKLIRSRNMGESDFLVRQVVHKDIRYL